MPHLAIWDDTTESYEYHVLKDAFEGLVIITEYSINGGAYSLQIGSYHCISNCLNVIGHFYDNYHEINDCAYFMAYDDMYTAINDQKKYTK